ncbi:Acetyltransferase (GNAT) family protein [Micromonospora pattaloongensis]|uniref:Acetyltransferase (GNAT) family protein n=1 Tax=Micromonospora pattaloongensis TaxID=405436 RepID=A0A1H3G5D3_9ACTN|nr:GNAT family N-acetyltransferase [Micromonospora pattaloongensis]SDX98461.1 Acetyltransferase (GNAT) family protein [Micromonospora pattaloongensis]
MLRRQDVGHRVVVRRIIGIRGERPIFSDALGELVDLTETDLTLATARGTLRVPLREIHRAKRVPAALRPTAAAVAALEQAANEAWPAPVQERLGSWLLRSADGWTGRANSALPIGDPDRPLEAAIDAVCRWYGELDQPAMINVPLPLAAPVGVALDQRGWGARPLTLVQTAPLPTILDAAPRRPDLRPVVLASAPSDAWLAIASGRKGGLPGAAHHLLTAVDRIRFAHVYDHDGELLAIARGTVTGAGRWLGLVLVEVVPHARRRGLAQHLIGELARWGLECGARDAFLQVEERNAAAVALYGRLGFRTHHTYLTRTAPAGT